MFLLILSLIIYSAPGKNLVLVPEGSNARSFTLQRQTASGKVTRVANSFPGADLGAKINAADKDLGATVGEILVQNGGIISTQVTINPGHTLRFGPGTYRLATELLWEGAVLLKSRTAVVGSGWDTIIVEPPRTGWTVFQSFEDIRTQPAHSGTDSDISVTKLQIKGANPGVDGSVRQTLQLGNCNRCRVEQVWLNGTGVIGIQAGGNALKGNFAEDVVIKNNLFTRVAGQTVAVVNGRNIVIDRNTFKESGRDTRQGMVPIDVEPNVPGDVAQNIQITNNVIDSRGSPFMHGNGILVQNGARTRNYGPVTVKGNTIIGDNLIDVGGNIATGIYISAPNVTVVDNTIQRVSHCGIRLENSSHAYVARNKIISAGTGGLFAFEITNTTDSQILDNIVTVDPRSPLANAVIVEAGTSRNNVYKGNTDGSKPILIQGRKGSD
ncbi:MAG TPA: right-handed parallel beta-helix repeat-containing protein [Pyrinomonadaceae bacterium]|nr:right-handed parallel beta-helix repeat-containing protein [Pyrinomonadaceae bacterium]